MPVLLRVNDEEIAGTFNKKKIKKTNQREFRIEKVNKGKGDKLHAKVKGYDNSFNKSTDKKCIVI